MSNRTRFNKLEASEKAFLEQSARPSGAAHAGFRPAYVNRLVVAGLIRPLGSTHKPLYPGSRGYTYLQSYVITDAGRRALSLEST